MNRSKAFCTLVTAHEYQNSFTVGALILLISIDKIGLSLFLRSKIVIPFCLGVHMRKCITCSFGYINSVFIYCSVFVCIVPINIVREEPLCSLYSIQLKQYTFCEQFPALGKCVSKITLYMDKWKGHLASLIFKTKPIAN